MRRTYAARGHSRDRGPDGAGDERVREEAVYLAAQKLALDLQTRIDGLISKPFAIERLAAIAKRIEERLLLIPGRCAARLAKEADPMEVRRLLEAEIRRARHELADALERGDARGPRPPG
jgi:hypothetical protein